MSHAVQLTPQARLDLQQIGVYLSGEGGLELEFRFYAAIQATWARLSRQPELGSPRRFRSPVIGEVRLWPVEDFSRHLVFYRSSEQAVTVLRVLHGRRKWQELLER